MIVCSNCNKKLIESSKYCPYCDTPLDSSLEKMNLKLALDTFYLDLDNLTLDKINDVFDILKRKYDPSYKPRTTYEIISHRRASKEQYNALLSAYNYLKSYLLNYGSIKDNDINIGNSDEIRYIKNTSILLPRDQESNEPILDYFTYVNSYYQDIIMDLMAKLNKNEVIKKESNIDISEVENKALKGLNKPFKIKIMQELATKIKDINYQYNLTNESNQIKEISMDMKKLLNDSLNESKILENNIIKNNINNMTEEERKILEESNNKLIKDNL